VHDIGKNIVGVVLGCNNYEVIDLGVMVSTDRILQTAIDEKVDMVGLSGLITPSLDEMVFVASEMERRGFTLPLLIGGATTSKQHTAVKIAPAYEHATVHVLDASRAVEVVSTLLNPAKAPEFGRDNKRKQNDTREQYAARTRRRLLTYSAARANGPQLEWTDVPAPSFTGRRFLDDEPLAEIARYIDWTLFFSTWELKGSFPGILDHPQYGAAARELYEHARELLQRIVDSRLLKARGSYGFWPANSDGDDIVVYQDQTRTAELLRFNMLRQQEALPSGQPNRSLADFVAPRESGIADYIGGFAVTAGLGADELVKRYERQHDDYRAIMVKALADRLAEAFTEYLHARVRREWGYGVTEALTNEELLNEKYRGIRPAFGYPACPDHTEKIKLFDLLAAQRVGIQLTESCAMSPAASVSGIYLSHPQARYFMLGRIGRDQLEHYASRKAQSMDETARWLAEHLDAEPVAASAT
jgi:5-methyltetrahydrofolate--homocysteine methyltransferase